MRIPTTDRKYYDTEKKINTLGAYASELLPAAKDLQAEIKEQQSIKMDKLGIEARMRMNDATNEWRLANQSNPNDPNALQDLQNQYDSILSDYRNEIDPLYRSQWDITGNKLKGAFDLENQAWGFKQRQENAKNDMADSVDSYLKLAFSYGQKGEFNKAIADFDVGYEKLLDFGAKNLGTETAASAMKEFESEYVKSYISGLSMVNPQAAMNMLKNKRVTEALGSDTLKTMNTIVTTQNKLKKLQSAQNTYNYQYNIDKELEGMNAFQQMGYIEKNKNRFTKKFYDAKMKELMTQAGVNAETKAETYTDLLIEINAIDTSLPAEDVINLSNDVLENIEKEYADGMLKTADMQRLKSTLGKIQGKKLPQLVKDKSHWYTPYDYGNAKDDFEATLSNSGKVSNAMLEYHRTVDENEEKGTPLDTKQKRELVKNISNRYNKITLNELANNVEKEKTMNVINWKNLHPKGAK